MKRVAIIADSHFSQSSRFEECIRLHNWIAEDIAARNVDLVCHCGDVFDAKSTPDERAAVASWLKAVAEVAPVLIVRGNHDVLGDLPLFQRLRTKHPIVVEEQARVYRIAGCAIAAMAWPRKAEILAAVGGDANAAGELSTEALRSVLMGMGAELAEFDGPRLMISHAMIRGSKTSVGQELCGCDFELGLEDLALAHAHLIGVGHIHMHQEWDCAWTPVIYPGSPRRTSFGEVEAKGYVVAEFIHYDGELSCEDGPGVRWCCDDWQFVEAPATPMRDIIASWVGGEFQFSAGLGQDVSGELRFRYSVDADQRDAAKFAAKELRDQLLADGATLVKVEEIVNPTTRARVPEVAQETTIEGKVMRTLEAKGIDLGERKPALLSKLTTIVEEGAAL